MSKFFSIKEYEETQLYKLLPFKLDRFNDHEYIITNMSGEYHLIDNEKIEKLINLELSETDSNFADLRSKQFIYYPDEKAPLELLGLKYRTKFSRLALFTNLHIFVVSLRCDHSCPYCQVSRQSEDKNSFDMTQEMADKSIDFVFRSPSPAVKIEFQGGEPLLNFDLVKYIVHKAEEINQIQGKDLQFVIATTLSLLTDDILLFCKEHDIVISSSLDGPETLHNKNRPRPGKNSHQKFIEGLNKARNVLGFDKVSALMTTTDNSLNHVKEIIDEYVDLGFDGIFLRSLSPYGFAIKTKKFLAYQADSWLEFYKEGLDYIIELNKKGVNFTEYYSSVILSKMLTSNDPGFVDLMNPSGIGIAAIVFNYDGNVYASDESRMLAEMNDETFNLGNILKDSYEDIMLSDKLLDPLEDSFTLSAPMCSDCSYESYCGADPIYHHATQKDMVGRKYESDFCRKNMSIFKHLIELMESDRATKQLFLKWANRC
jgi:uncharacterized protein